MPGQRKGQTPPVYPNSLRQAARRMFRRGDLPREIAAALGPTRRTIANWTRGMEQDPDDYRCGTGRPVPKHLVDRIIRSRMLGRGMQDIANRLGVSRNTVKRYLAAAGFHGYIRKGQYCRHGKWVDIIPPAYGGAARNGPKGDDA